MLTAEVDEDSEFQWDGDKECADGELLLLKDTTCIANFKLPPKTLTITAVEHGTISTIPWGIFCGSDDNQCRHTFKGGSKVTLIIIPDNGWEFDGWEGPCVENEPIAMMRDLTCKPQFVSQSATSDKE